MNEKKFKAKMVFTFEVEVTTRGEDRIHAREILNGFDMHLGKVNLYLNHDYTLGKKTKDICSIKEIDNEEV